MVHASAPLAGVDPLCLGDPSAPPSILHITVTPNSVVHGGRVGGPPRAGTEASSRWTASAAGPVVLVVRAGGQQVARLRGSSLVTCEESAGPHVGLSGSGDRPTRGKAKEQKWKVRRRKGSPAVRAQRIQAWPQLPSCCFVSLPRVGVDTC